MAEQLQWEREREREGERERICAGSDAEVKSFVFSSSDRSWIIA